MSRIPVYGVLLLTLNKKWCQMKKIALAVSAILLLGQLAAEVKIAVKDGNISADNGSVSFNLQKKKTTIFST